MASEIIARKYLGQRETPNNSGFKDKAFEKKMTEVGWSKSLAWCSYFAELVWKEAFPEKKKEFDKLFSGSATATFKNFELAKWKVGGIPKPGALVVWRYGNGWQGHIGIVSTVRDNGIFTSIEGNTNAAGGREGIEVAEKVRNHLAPYTANGLNIIGFIYEI